MEHRLQCGMCQCTTGQFNIYEDETYLLRKIVFCFNKQSDYLLPFAWLSPTDY